MPFQLLTDSSGFIEVIPCDFANVLKVSWTSVYEGWKELTNQLIRAYTNCEFESWTVPCLYVAGKYLRIFAIKADEGAAANGTTAITNFQDDISPEAEKNEKLEDAARQLNRIFQLCLSDRYEPEIKCNTPPLISK